MRICVLLLVSTFVFQTAPVYAQRAADHPVIVDEQGVMRWSTSGEEVALFGVNYSTPFAFGYRAHGYIGADRKQAIDADVAHLARLGLDAFRIHVWDREISDRQGNLIENDHLDLLDYLIARLEERGIKTILTPIAWWPPGYPEPAPETEGFSNYYNKGEMAVDLEARRAQENYLKQFIVHVNPYTGRSYRDDPDIIAVELFNEPSHPGGPEETTRFIDALASALREAGFRKPIFYNISQGYSDTHGQAVCTAEIQGVTLQWYPTGLVRGSTIQGNMLPNVDRYPIPFADLPACRDKALMVYEFDAADVAGSYMYPAMARSFRSAGFQWATQFAYDPLAIAYSNTEYQTHFLNLVYTPKKAISFMISGEAFRHVPRGASYGTYPETHHFGPFRVSYEEDLSEMVTDTAFFYSSDTRTAPPAPSALRHVAGVGRSPVVSYEGTGAYFLNRLEDGVWRLEVYPDAARVEDPYTRPSLQKTMVHVLWRAWPMQISLPDLGTDFTVEPVNAGNDHRPTVSNGTLSVRPGVYVLTRTGAAHPPWTPAPMMGNRALGEFFAPPTSITSAAVVHTPPAEMVAGTPFVVRAEVVSSSPVDSVLLFARRIGGGGRARSLPMEHTGAYTYAAEVPPEQMRAGLVEYGIVVYTEGRARTFPGGEEGHPSQWDFTGQSFWQVSVVDTHVPLVLFDARRDRNHLLYPHPWGYVRFRTDLVGGTMPDRLALHALAENFEPEPHHLAIRSFIPDEQKTRLAAAGPAGVLRIRARTAGQAAGQMEVALVEKDGTAWGAVLSVTDTWQEITIPLEALRRTPLALLPRPYPGFLPYVLEADTASDAPDLSNLDGLQFSVRSDFFDAAEQDGPHGFEIEQVLLDRR